MEYSVLRYYSSLKKSIEVITSAQEQDKKDLFVDTTNLIIVRGGGDIASGTIHRLHNSGLKLLVLETQTPTAIRRTVAYSEAVFEGHQTVDGITARFAQTLDGCDAIWQQEEVPVLIDHQGSSIRHLSPLAIIDCTLRKQKSTPIKDLAPITIGLGPGFSAGTDVDAVIETHRGHNLGKIIYQGSAQENTGIPGNIEGYSRERVIYASASGCWQMKTHIGTQIEKGALMGFIDNTPVTASISGIVRGILRDGFAVKKGLKLADIDPRYSEISNCFTISDKARCISGGVLEAVLFLKRALNQTR